RRRHTRFSRDWSSDVCSSDLGPPLRSRVEMPPHPDRPENVTTWLVIPYFDGDVGRKGGERPLPAAKGASWLCPAFRVDGVPGNTAFERGQPFQLELEVANWGAGTLPAVALVRLWWSDPAMSFAKATPIGQTSVVVPPDGKP